MTNLDRIKLDRKTAVSEQFDRISKEYFSERLSPENIRERQRIFSLINCNVKYQHALDIGCGPGTIAEDMLKISEKVYGIDISEDMVKTAVEKFSHYRHKDRVFFEVGDAESLKFPDQYFDVVFCIGVLRYTSSWERAMQEIYRVLKPDGVVVVTFFYRFSPHWFSMSFLYRPLLPVIALAQKISLKACIAKYKAEPLPFSYRKFKKVFYTCGFREMELQHSGFTVFPVNRLFPKLSTNLYLKMESAFFKSSILGWLGSICIVKGTK